MRNEREKTSGYRREKSLREPHKKPSRRVFRWAVDKVAFIDKVRVGIHGERKPNFEEQLRDHHSQGIYTRDSLYSRAVRGRFIHSGNPVEVLYGKKKMFKNVPDIWVTMHSERIPLTGTQVRSLVKGLTIGPSRVRVSLVEFTFDVTGVTIEYILRHLDHAARTADKVFSDDEGRKTIYVGSPRSAWQGRIYQKRRSVVRIEFILRRAFLSRNGITKPEHLLLLRRLNVWKLMSITRFRRTRLQKKLEAMQRRLLW